MTAHTQKNLPQIPGACIAILQAKWYREYTDNLVKKCLEVLKETGCETPDVHILPGSLELPLAARRVARNRDRKYEAIICFGAIVKGETFHFEMIMNECMRGLGQVMFEEDIPILVEVLPVLKLEHLIARSGDNEHNKGIEAAIAAAEIIDWRRKNP